MDKNQEPSEEPQATGIGSGQELYQPVASASSSDPEERSTQKPSKWRYLFITLGILQIFGVATYILAISWTIQQANTGVSDTGYMALFILMVFAPVVGIVALINLVGLSIYIRNHKPHGKGLVLSIISLGISASLALFLTYGTYQFQLDAARGRAELDREIERESLEIKQFIDSNAKP